MIERLIIFGIVSHQCLHKIRLEFFDFGLVILTILKLKLRLAAFLGGHAGDVPVRMRIPENSGPKLRVDKNATMFLRNAFAECKLEGVVNDGFALGDSFGLFLCQWSFQPKQSFLERTAMIKGQDVKGFVISDVNSFLLARNNCVLSLK